jgi:vancomycin resistance protein YoaR
VALVLVAVAGGTAGRWALARWWPLAGDAARTLPGLRIDGCEVGDRPGGAMATAEARSRALDSRRVRLVAAGPPGTDSEPEVVIEASLGELGVWEDPAATAARAMRVGRQGDPMARARLADAARRGEVDIPLEPRLDARKLFAHLLSAKEHLDAPALDARLDLGNSRIVEEHAGRALDLDGAAEAVLHAAADAAVTEVALPFVPVHARVTRASLARIDVSHVLASFQTFFSRRGDQGPRARNIEVAAGHIDGLVLEPGQLVSFNGVVGARSEENGFKRAFEIFKGEYVEGTGGGTCQVASTLHAVAFFGGLEILERLPHSRPSAYIPAGLDATVVYPAVDLKLRNPFPFSVAVHASVTANALKMELLGADKVVTVAFGTEVLGTTPFDRKVDEDPAVRAPKRKQKGADGLELRKMRVLAYVNGKRRIEMSHELYPPTKEIWKVPPGFDVTTLPPLGEDMPPPEAAKPQASRFRPGSGEAGDLPSPARLVRQIHQVGEDNLVPGHRERDVDAPVVGPLHLAGRDRLVAPAHAAVEPHPGPRGARQDGQLDADAELQAPLRQPLPRRL